MPKDYDVEEAFRAIENELINSMMRNLSHHRAEEMKEGLNWTSWQAEQLKALNVYKQKNQKKFTKIFADINRNIEKSIDRKSTRLNSSHTDISRMPSSA